LRGFIIKNVICAVVLLLTGCTAVETVKPAQAKPKNVIMIIGDGMGPQQVGLLLSYARQAPHSVIADRTTAFDRMLEQGRLGISLTHPDNALVTDSAASATQLATGHMAGAEMIGLDKDGNRQETLVEKAKRIGKATGLVSDTRITHATPAAFAAHQTHRSLENEIAEDLLNAESDVMLSAGLNYWIPKQANDHQSPLYQELVKLTENSYPIRSKRKDNKNLLSMAQQKGYGLAFNKTQLEQANGKTLGLFAGSEIQNGIIETQLKDSAERVQPTLKEMSAKALELLGKNERGFFLMIEAGQIDWASHHNDTGLLLHEMLRLNETLHTVLDWAKNRNDTLIIVTADHETGGFGFSYSAAGIPAPRSLPGAYFKNGIKFAPGFNYGRPEILDKLYAQQRSYHDIFAEFDDFPAKQQTAAMLAGLVNRYSEFKISEAQAIKILSTETNPYHQPGHSALGLKEVPKMAVNDAFFVYHKENRENLLARAVSAGQQAVWSTGTHTSTPVYVFVTGPDLAAQPFTKILHHSQIGKLAIDALE
jgi:alkaline phosphatase